MRRLTVLAALLVLTGVARGQLLPSIPTGTLPIPGLSPVEGVAGTVLRMPEAAARTLADARRAMIDRLVRDNPGRVALDPQGFPARAGEVVVDAPDDALLRAASARGYRLIEHDDVLGVSVGRLSVPDGKSLKAAIAEIRKLGGEVSADQLHFASGAVTGSPAPPDPRTGPMVGVIDGGVSGATLSAGFASGAPRANDHGTAVASLLAGSGNVRGGLPGARNASADEYGSDPPGGTATAIAK
ncbi:MAG: S8 family serine peptidase, partial [Sphingomonas sp.]